MGHVLSAKRYSSYEDIWERFEGPYVFVVPINLFTYKQEIAGDVVCE